MQLCHGFSQGKQKARGTGAEQGIFSLTTSTPNTRCFWARVISLVITQQCPNRRAVCQMHVITLRSRRTLLSLGIFPRKISLQSHFTSEPTHGKGGSRQQPPPREFREPRPAEDISLRPSHMKTKEPNPISHIFTPLACQNTGVVQQQFRCLP